MNDICARFLKFLLVLLCVGLTGGKGIAETAGIRQPIDETARIALAGNTPRAVKGAIDLGAVNASTPSLRMLLVLRRSAAQEAELKQFLGDLQNKNSPNYHKWLTPQQFGDRFGVSAGDAQILESWLEGHGFTVDRVGTGRTSIQFSGTVGQLQQAFHTSIHRYLVGTEEHLANANDPEIPAALAPVISGIIGLDDFFPKPATSAQSRANYDRQTHAAKPQTTTTGGGSLLYVGPSDAAAIYDTPNRLNANFKGGQAYTGSGVTIAVVSDGNIDPGVVAAYRSFFGLPASATTVIVDGNDPGINQDSPAALGDVEIAAALAPDAKVNLYAAKDTTLVSGLYLALARAVDDNLSDIIQFGFSNCEAKLSATDNKFFAYEWGQAAADGVTVVAAAGDSGPADCDPAGGGSTATQGLAVNGYASTMYDVAVGGSDFDALRNDLSTYLGSNGIAVGYIPELPWNNSVAIGGNGALANNAANPATNDFAGGGGASSCAVAATAPATGCAGYSKPNWQLAGGSLNIPQDDVRDLPDVSLLAGTGQYGATWAVCGDGDCLAGGGSSATIEGFGGTSAAASAFAGILALVGESQLSLTGGQRLGQANYVLYNLANQSELYGSVFHDIKTGNNSVICTGSRNCANGFLTGYNAGPGYDQASGLGSVDASALVSNWSKAIFTPTTIRLTINGGTGPVSVIHGTPISLQIAVSGSGGTPTGTVSVQANVDETSNTYGDDVGFAGPLNNGSYKTTVASEPGGTYNNWASYAGDLNFAASTSPVPVELIVEREPSTLALSLYAGASRTTTTKITKPNEEFVYGTYVSVDAQPFGNSGQGVATGTVTFTDSFDGKTYPISLNRRGFAEIPTYYTWPAGTHSFTASYLGDNSFEASPTPAASSFTIAQVTSTVMVTATPSSLISGNITVTGTVAAKISNLGNPPTGSVTLSDSTTGLSLGSAMLLPGNANSTFTFTIPASQLALSQNNLTVTYGGDGNYTGSSASTMVTRLATVATAVTLAASPASLMPGGRATITGTVKPSTSAVTAAPTGTIALVDTSNGTPLGSASLVPGVVQNGIATATFSLTVSASSLRMGPNELTASYTGDSNYSASEASASVTLEAQVATSLTMSGIPASLVTGSSTISGQITPSAAGVTAAPSGTVTLVDANNGAQLGTAVLSAVSVQDGIAAATFSLAVNATSLTMGANTVIASYAGDSNYSGSTGQTTVTRLPPPARALTIDATNVNIPTPGQTTGNTSTITVTPEGGFTGQVNLTAELVSGPVNAVSAPTVTLSSASVTIAGTAPATATAAVATTALTYAMQRPLEQPRGRWYETAGGAALAGLLLLGMPGRRRSWRAMLGLLLFAGSALGLGCGVHLNALKTAATTPGTYVFSVNGVDQATGMVKGSTSFTVMVQ
jgi:hypothetical protein